MHDLIHLSMIGVVTGNVAIDRVFNCIGAAALAGVSVELRYETVATGAMRVKGRRSRRGRS
ncbi:hypothetical protein [Inquilinus sp. CA228]|uniref:hypothetical protein n=1 Tax=Inquilinus sp. CA228 TaxID=3455609 RepID=UPI003F8CF8B5